MMTVPVKGCNSADIWEEP